MLYCRSHYHLAGTTAVHVIGLDRHSFHSHPCEKKRTHEWSAICNDFAVLPVGDLAEGQIPNFKAKFHKLLLQIQQRTGTDRSAAGNKQGHQRTPSIIHALLLQALRCKCKYSCNCPVILPEGGFTDVGLHTGGRERDTCFPLVRSVFEWSLKQNRSNASTSYATKHLYFAVVMAHFHIFILDVQDLTYTRGMLNKNILQRDGKANARFSIIKIAACNASDLSDDGHNMNFHFKKLSSHIEQIKKTIDYWEIFHLKKFTIMEDSCSLINLVEKRCPRISIKELSIMPVRQKVSIFDYQRLRNENSSGLRIPSLNLNSLLPSVNYAEAIYKNPTNRLLFLRSIEEFMWKLCDTNLPTTNIAFGQLLNYRTASKCTLNSTKLMNLMEIVSNYRFVLNDGVVMKEVSYLETQLMSIEVLVVWVAYCVTFSHLKDHFPNLMKKFGVAIDYKHLDNLVLQDKRHIDVMLIIVSFLKQNDKRPLFSLKYNDSWDSGTHLFGEKYARKNLKNIYDKEVQDSNKRNENHWNEIIEKRKLVTQLNNSLISHTKTRKQEQVEYYDAKDIEASYKAKFLADYSDSSDSNWKRENTYNRDFVALNYKNQIANCLKKITATKNRINQIKRDIVSVQKAPPPVYQPLPLDKSKSMKVLFFLYMPDRFKMLATLSFTAEQMFLPLRRSRRFGCDKDNTCQSKILSEIVISPQFSLFWHSYYDGKKNYVYHNPKEKCQSEQGKVSLGMKTGIPSSFGPTHIDNFHCTSDGVFYPDSCGISMVWSGGEYDWDKHPTLRQFNPFIAIEKKINGKKVNRILSF